MKKIILRFALMLVFSIILAISAFAYEVPEQYEGTNYGASYNTDHDNDCCPYPQGTGVEHPTHYDEGYSDGFKDGLESDGLSEDEKQAFLEQYHDSDEFKALLAQAVNDYKASSQFGEDMKNTAEYQGAIVSAYQNGYNAGQEDYKGSDSYRNDLYAQYENGVNSGYNLGYNSGYFEAEEKLYDKGMAEGFANFRDSAEYKATLQAQFDGGYNEGYLAGANDSQNVKSDDNSVSVSSLLTLVLSVISLGALSVFLFIHKRKKGKNRK